VLALLESPFAFFASAFQLVECASPASTRPE
jgi:hypothetical protein